MKHRLALGSIVGFFAPGISIRYNPGHVVCCRYSTDKDGGLKEDATSLVQNMILTPDQAELVRQCGDESLANEQPGTDPAV